MRLPSQKKNVRPPGSHSLKGFGSPRNSIVDNDRFHKRIIGKRDNAGDEGLLLRHKIIWVGDMLNHATVFDASVLLYELFRSAKVIFRLRDCTGNDTDMEFGLGLGEYIGTHH